MLSRWASKPMSCWCDVASAPLTIALPVYNGERFLGEAIESILSQDYTDFALHISDNASTDATEEIGRELAARDRRVTFERHPVNRGMLWNFNHCVRATESPLFKWAAHDDVLLPQWLGRCVEVLEERPEAVLAFTRRVKIDEAGTVVKQNKDRELRFTEPDSPPHVRFEDWLRLRRGCIEVFGVARRSVMLETRLLGQYQACDRVYLAEMALRGPFAEVPEVLFLHREHRGRSIRMARDEGQQLHVFGTSTRGAFAFPTWRLAFEYGRAVHRAPVPRDERWRSYAALNLWCRRRWRLLVDNVVDAVRAVVTGRTPRR